MQTQLDVGGGLRICWLSLRVSTIFDATAVRTLSAPFPSSYRPLLTLLGHQGRTRKLHGTAFASKAEIMQFNKAVVHGQQAQPTSMQRKGQVITPVKAATVLASTPTTFNT